MQHAVDCAKTYGGMVCSTQLVSAKSGCFFDHHPSLSEQTNASHTRLFVKIVFPDKNKKCLSGTKKTGSNSANV